jgi:hypothetical protein
MRCGHSEKISRFLRGLWQAKRYDTGRGLFGGAGLFWFSASAKGLGKNKFDNLLAGRASDGPNSPSLARPANGRNVTTLFLPAP